MKSVPALLLIMLSAVCAKQGSGQKEQNNINTFESDFRHPGSKRISRAVSGADLSPKDGDGSMEDESPQLGVVDDDFRTFFGTHPQQFEQLMDLLNIKAQVKRKAASCNLRDICTHWSNKSFVTRHADHLKKLLQMFAVKEDTFSGAIANGWLRKNCTEIYVECKNFIRVVTSLEGDHLSTNDATTSAAPKMGKLPQEYSTDPSTVPTKP